MAKTIMDPTEIVDGPTLQAYLRGQAERFDILARHNGQLNGALKAFGDSPGARGPFAHAEAFGKIMQRIAKGGGADIEKADLGTPLVSDATTGSYLVPQEHAKDVLRLAQEQSELLPLVRKYPMTSRTMIVPTYASGAVFTYLASDTADISESNPTFGQLSLTANSYATWAGVSEQLVEDSAANLGAYLATLFAEAWVTKAEAELLTATGSPCTGVLADPGVNTARMTGPTFDSLTFDDIVATVTELDTKSKRRGARWILHPTVLDVVTSIKNAVGDPIFRVATDGRPATIHGFPFVLSDAMPDSGDSAADTAMLAFGNPNTMVHGDRVQLEVKAFDGTSYRALNSEIVFRARFRAAFDIGIPSAWAVLKTAVL